MNKTQWIRIVIASLLLAVLGACADMQTGGGGSQREESAIPMGG